MIDVEKDPKDEGQMVIVIVVTISPPLPPPPVGYEACVVGVPVVAHVKSFVFVESATKIFLISS
jgi:hypothetical protein